MGRHGQRNFPNPRCNDNGSLPELGHPKVCSVDDIARNLIPEFRENFFDLLRDPAAFSIVIMTQELGNILDKNHLWIQCGGNLKESEHEIVPRVLIKLVVSAKPDNLRTSSCLRSSHLRKSLAGGTPQ